MTISDWFNFVRLSLRKEDGQTMAEYGVILAVLAVAGIVTFGILSNGIGSAIDTVSNAL